MDEMNQSNERSEWMEDAEGLENMDSSVSEGMNEAFEILTFHDEQGNPADFEYVGTVEHEGAYYLILHPCDSDEAEDEFEVMILQLEKDEQGLDCYRTVSDESLLHVLLEEFNAMDEMDRKALDDILGPGGDDLTDEEI